MQYRLMVRQVLNAEVAIQLAKQEAIEWIVHLDADECLYTDSSSVPEYLGSLSSDIEQVSFVNLEVVPDRFSITDYFADLTLFKRNLRTFPSGRFSSQQHELIRRIKQIPPGWFFYYDNGKSAARISARVRPEGVHSFSHVDGSSLNTVVAERPCVLHYMNAGFENFMRRYRTWGSFPDYWYGSIPIRSKIGDFHLTARDVVMSNDIAAAERFYQDRVVISDVDTIQELLRLGLCERIQGPSTLLELKSC